MQNTQTTLQTTGARYASYSMRTSQILVEALIDEKPIVYSDKVIKDGLLTCPHCQKEIYEKHTYLNDKGQDVHSDCGGVVKFKGLTDEEKVRYAEWLRHLEPTSSKTG